ncbi:hypothetical protein [Thauera aminoaromatica]|jgi:hypothetical protein|uniref:Uncharacterized protein n=2 Tax=Thauera aminoaromatica TaxID=164330 RepID=C4ZIN5_THASP|nr:hypothetical protein [Thauera aminoaromatica]NUQ48761.1 hypothetical protein [Phycisphaerae bacterium]TMW78525.1 hypothetical protein FG147_01880 [Thauera sp. UPWRP]HNU11793.1 hypothetical protein [Rubrivivax sp.]ACK53172.1 conserved hypothetical protein [Thauera aminoaromatica]ENO85640.1 hypothetical protein C665_09792 [Thauera aminoaromatica S2]
MIRCACLADTADTADRAKVSAEVELLFRFDEPGCAPLVEDGGIAILRQGDETRAAALLEAGAPQVLLGEAVLSDADLPLRLAARFGLDRVGLFVPARRMAVSWSFDTVSNADFRVVTPSLCEPGWEIVRADGSATGIRVDWWLGEMKKRGIATVLVQVDVLDDTDLNLCAGLVEALGEGFWIAPGGQFEPALADWVRYGKVTRIALPTALFERRAVLLGDLLVPVEPMTDMEEA